MFGLFKISGAPPKVFRYYRATKDANEKRILEDLYKSYDALIKLKDVQTSGNSEYRNKMVLKEAFNDLYDYGKKKGYPEELITLFYQY